MPFQILSTRCCAALALLGLIASGTGCRLEPPSVRFQVIVLARFGGLCVVVLRGDEAIQEPVRVEIGEDGVGYLAKKASILRLEGVFSADGRRLEDLESVQRETDVGYKWICTTGEGRSWFFIGTREQYRALEQQRHHRVGPYEF
jgi:hypothetical protein